MMSSSFSIWLIKFPAAYAPVKGKCGPIKAKHLAIEKFIFALIIDCSELNFAWPYSVEYCSGVNSS